MSRPVDVLAAIDNAIEADGRAHSITRAELHDARSAVAELIEAAKSVSDSCIANYGNCMGLHLAVTGIGGLNERLILALARVRARAAA